MNHYGGTNLYKFGTRYDAPSLGRWTQQDPVGGSLGDLNAANRYTYAGDNPVNAVDPSGKDFWSCFWAGINTAFFGFLVIVTIAAILTIETGITALFAIIGVAATIKDGWTLVDQYRACFG